jgi:hypothetical protein
MAVSSDIPVIWNASQYNLVRTYVSVDTIVPIVKVDGRRVNHSEEGGNNFFRNVGAYVRNYMTSHTIKVVIYILFFTAQKGSNSHTV